MTAYAIDSRRWLVGVAEDGAPGAVPKEPPSVEASTATPGDPWPRWYRFEWRVEPYQVAPVPAAVTMRQARIALLGAGLLDDVEAAIDAISDAATRQAARITWDYSTEVQRHNDFVAMLAPAMGLSDAQLDALFIAAAEL